MLYLYVNKQKEIKMLIKCIGIPQAPHTTNELIFNMMNMIFDICIQMSIKHTCKDSGIFHRFEN